MDIQFLGNGRHLVLTVVRQAKTMTEQEMETPKRDSIDGSLDNSIMSSISTLTQQLLAIDTGIFRDLSHNSRNAMGCESKIYMKGINNIL